MPIKILAVTALTASLLVSAPLRAHHLFKAEFDSSKPVLLKGTVTKLEWINPHSWIHLDVREPNGALTSWLVECASLGMMQRTGLTRAADVGSQITVQGFQSKDRPHTAGATNIVKGAQSFSIPIQEGLDGRTIVKTRTATEKR